MRINKINKLNLGFNIGDEVNVNPDHVYISYTQFVNKHKKYAARYQYKQNLDKNSSYKVIDVCKHVINNVYDENKYVVVLIDKFKRIYLSGELGVNKI